MEFALGIYQLPESSVVWIAIEHVPPTRVTSELHQIRLRKREYSLADVVSDRARALKNPLPTKDRL